MTAYKTIQSILDLLCVSPRASIREVIAVINRGAAQIALVTESDRLIGIVTDGDLRRHMLNNLAEQLVTKVMTAGPITITSAMIAAEALNIMNDRKITAMFVVDEAQKPVGIVHIHDFLRAGVA